MKTEQLYGVLEGFILPPWPSPRIVDIRGSWTKRSKKKLIKTLEFKPGGGYPVEPVFKSVKEAKKLRVRVLHVTIYSDFEYFSEKTRRERLDIIERAFFLVGDATSFPMGLRPFSGSNKTFGSV